MQDKPLLHQLGPYHLDPNQMHLGVRLVGAEPGRAATEPQAKGQGEQKAFESLGDHRTSPL
ncbi:hypothetical protein D3C75_1294590 [compost metagenome]